MAEVVAASPAAVAVAPPVAAVALAEALRVGVLDASASPRHLVGLLQRLLAPVVHPLAGDAEFLAAERECAPLERDPAVHVLEHVFGEAAQGAVVFSAVPEALREPVSSEELWGHSAPSSSQGLEKSVWGFGGGGGSPADSPSLMSSRGGGSSECSHGVPARWEVAEAGPAAVAVSGPSRPSRGGRRHRAGRRLRRRRASCQHLGGGLVDRGSCSSLHLRRDFGDGGGFGGPPGALFQLLRRRSLFSLAALD